MSQFNTKVSEASSSISSISTLTSQSTLDRKAEKQALMESMHSFADSRPGSVRLQSIDLFIGAKSFSHPHESALQIVREHNQPLGANPLAFLKSYFGEEFAADEIQERPGSMVYKEPAGALRKSFHTLFVESILSLSVSYMTQYFHILPGQASIIRLLSTIERSTFLHEPTVIQHHVFSSVLPHLTMVHRETREALRTVEKILGAFFGRESAHQGKTVTMPTDDRRPHTSPTNLQWLTRYAGGQERGTPQDLQRQRGNSWSTAPLVFSHRFNQQTVANGSQTTRVLSPFSFEKTVGRGLGSFLSYVGEGLIGEASPRLGKAPALEPFILSPRMLQLAEEYETERATLPMPSSPFAEASFAPVLNRKLATRVIPKSEDANSNRPESSKQQLTFLRRETPLELPPLSYVYTQPPRVIAEEQHVVKKVEHKEVVEIARKEVQTLMSSSSLVTHFSRNDYVRIADQVYSTLAKRLIVEKERLGSR